MDHVVGIFAALFGACVGSFLNVVIHRLPQDELSVASPRHSFCPKCKTTLGVIDNIPILSWLFLRAKCRHCSAPISARYPAVELLTAGLFWLSFHEYSWTLEEGGIAIGLPVLWCLYSAVLVSISFIDIDLQIIPDELSVSFSAIAPVAAWIIPGTPLGTGFSEELVDRVSQLQIASLPGGVAALTSVGIVVGAICAVLFRSFSPAVDGGLRKWSETPLAFVVGGLAGVALYGIFAVDGWLSRTGSVPLVGSLCGMAVGAGSIWSVGVLGKMLFKKDAMGFGDVKLMAFLGAVLGWQYVLAAIFVACLIGSVIGIAEKVRTGESYLPFGPFLAAGALVLVFANDQVRAVFEWYQSLLTIR